MSVAVQREVRFTYDDYRTWPDGERWEIINGESYALAGPSTQHQAISRNLTAALAAFFRKTPCRVFAAPLDVKLAEDTVVQPDLLVVCRHEQITGSCITGAPTLIVEILSPNSYSIDRFLKFKRYAEAGVREYWIVTPAQAAVEVYTLENGHYRLHEGYLRNETLASVVFPTLTLSLADVFDEPAADIPQVKESLVTPSTRREPN